LKKSVGEYGQIYRIGGDGFSALLSADKNTLDDLINKLQNLTDNWEGNSVKNLSISKEGGKPTSFFV
jgi:hypothetical protein